MHITGKVRMIEAIEGPQVEEDGGDDAKKKPQQMSLYHIHVGEATMHRQLSIPLPTGSFREHDAVKISITKG